MTLPIYGGKKISIRSDKNDILFECPSFGEHEFLAADSLFVAATGGLLVHGFSPLYLIGIWNIGRCEHTCTRPS